MALNADTEVTSVAETFRWLALERDDRRPSISWYSADTSSSPLTWSGRGSRVEWGSGRKCQDSARDNMNMTRFQWVAMSNLKQASTASDRSILVRHVLNKRVVIAKHASHLGDTLALTPGPVPSMACTLDAFSVVENTYTPITSFGLNV